MARQPKKFIDGFVLSNIGELLSQEETDRLFTALAPAATSGARICFRNIIIPRVIPEALVGQIVLDEALSRHLLATDRSFLYPRVQAYVVDLIQPA